MIQKKSDDAVSPVIGVMLMIVIVVIIAAVVTAFATGMMSETEAAPVAALDVEILNSEASLSDVRGPELFITHRSGDAVDTKDIELQFSWVCGVPGCTSGGVHSSIYSADGFKEEHPNGLNTGTSGVRMQALYVKSTMSPERTEYGSEGINHYFGDVILTPGLKLTASSEFLPEYEKNTASPFMEMVFNTYDDSIVPGTEASVTYSPQEYGESEANHRRTGKCSICYPAADAAGDGNGETKSGEWNAYCNNPENWDKCDGLKKARTCKECGHTKDKCTEENDPGHNCKCCTVTEATAGSDGIMDHLPAGTAVDVMIIHTPSGKAIYDKTVIVE